MAELFGANGKPMMSDADRAFVGALTELINTAAASADPAAKMAAGRLIGTLHELDERGYDLRLVKRG